MSDPWVVHKFGGTSVASAERYRHVGEVVAGRPEGRRAAVVSAMGGVTDVLVRAVELAGARDERWRDEIETIRARHYQAATELLSDAERDALFAVIDRDVAEISDVLHATALMRSHSRTAMDLVSGYGEAWSAHLLAGHLRERGEAVRSLDAREVLVVDWSSGRAEVDWETSRARLDAWLGTEGGRPETLVITGYVAATPQGVATTLGRNGSDYSASIFAALLDAAEVHIWTDVDGVMSANPRLVPEAVRLDALSYNEAMELAYFGAKVIHPATMAPAVRRGLPIWIRNTFRPENPGTRIHLAAPSSLVVKGFATVEEVALVNVEGTGMIGVPGTAERLFGALRDAAVSVVMISQGSSEHSICFVIPGEAAQRAKEAVERAFFAERHHGQIQTVEVAGGCCVLAAVGDGMAGHPGVAARFFGALGQAGVNIRAIAQGSSERNISVVIDQADASRALRAVHSGFYLSRQTLSIGVIGTGVVGGTLLRQLAEHGGRIRDEHDVDLRVRAIATSRRMLLDDLRIGLDDWRERMEAEGAPLDLDALADHVHAEHLPHAVLVDCTADGSVARRYAGWLRRGIHVITPNKRASTADLDSYRELRRAAREAGVHYLYETTVGAGLPIVQTLRDLIRTGDEVLEIEGILSGTLAYLFNAYDGSRPFSEIVADARAMGYTEPDPRDDLSGTDVARKVTILAREMGLPLELEQVEVESLVPAELRAGTVEEFMAALPAHDAAMRDLWGSARERGEVLRFVGAVDRSGRASARLVPYPADHPFARIRLTDNIVQFRTTRYDRNPLIVQGPGAGPDVTAGGVFAELLRLAAFLGATL